MLYTLFPNITEHPIFLGVKQAHIDKYFCDENIDIRCFEAEDVAYSSESDSPHVGILVTGVARVYAKSASEDEESALLRTLHSGDIFGIANLYAEDKPFPSKIIAATELKIMFVKGDIFKSFIENDNTALKNYLALQSNKIVYLNKKISTFTAGSAEKKLAMFMLDHLDGDNFTSPCSMSQLADMLHMGRASLYRSLDALSEGGIIFKEGKNTYKVDVQKIKNL